MTKFFSYVLISFVACVAAAQPETEVINNVGTLTITDINGGSSNDDLIISYAGGTYTISDQQGLILTTVIAGATGDGTDTLTIPDTGVTGIVFDTLGGNDSVTVNSAQASLTDEFSVLGGPGNDDVTVNPAISMPSTVEITAESISLSGNINSTGNQTYNGHLLVGAGLTLDAVGAVGIDGVLDFAETLTVNGDLSLNASATLQINLDGPTAGTDFDQLVVSGAVTLGGAILEVAKLPAFTPTVGDEFLLIDNDGVDPINGNLLGGVFEVDGLNFAVDYSGGDGNDLVLVVVASPPSSLVVDTIVDESDGVFSPGDLSLREAIQLANLETDANTITFDPALTGGGPATILLQLGEIAITESVSITSAGPNPLTISGNSAHRIFNIDEGDNNSFVIVAIEGLNFIDGRALDGSVNNGKRGGAIINTEYLTLKDCAFSGNAAQDHGGAIYNVLGDMVVDGVTFSGNTATTEGGGGLFLDLGTHTISNSTFTSNHAGDQGGGLGINLFQANLNAQLQNVNFITNTANQDGGGLIKSGGGELVLQDCQFNGNIAGDDGGGAFILSGTARVEDSSFLNNTAAGDGGGLVSFVSTTTIQRSVFDGNVSNSNVRGGGGLYIQSASARIEESTIINNNATNDDGGGIMKLSANLTIVNSTISGNSAAKDGGGIASQSSTTTIVNSTVKGNTASDDGGGLSQTSGTIRIRNTLVVGNNAADDGDEVFGAVVADGNNLLGRNNRTNGQAFSGFTPGPSDITATSNGTQPTALASILNPTLANNGGPTVTHLLVANSPAINAGDGTLATDDGTAGGSLLATDQRLFPRFFGTAVDIGAVQISSATTEVALAANAITITDVAGGNSTDDLALSYAGGTYTLTDRGGLKIRAKDIAGSTGSGTDTVTFPDTGIISIDVDTKDGDDRVVVNSLEPSLPLGFGIADSNGLDLAIITDGPIDVGGGDFAISSESIRIETDVTTTGNQVLDGAVQLVGDRILGGGNVLFQSSVDTAEVLEEILVAEFGAGEIERFDTFGVSLGTFAAGLSGPRGLARDTAGNIYVVEETTGEIEKFAADGTPLGTLVTGLASPFDIDIDSTGDIFVTEPASGEVERFDSSGTPLGTFLSGRPGVTGIDATHVLGIDYVGIAFPDNVEVFEANGTPHFAATSTGLSTPRDIQLDDIDAPTIVDYDGRIEIVLGDSTTTNLQFGLNLPEDRVVDAQFSNYLTVGAASGKLLKDSGSGPLTIVLGLNEPDGLLIVKAPGVLTSSLTVNASGLISFGAPVGDLLPLDSLITNTSGATEILGSITNTIGAQTFGGTLLASDGTTLMATIAQLNGDAFLAAGASGTLSVEGDVIFGGGASLTVDLHGTTPGSEHDQLRVMGAGRTVDLNNASLSAEIDGGYGPMDGDELVIVHAVDPSTTIVGSFAGLAEGSTITISGHVFTITYSGGDGNDVVLQLILPRADLAVTNTASTDLVSPGDHITYTIDFLNNGLDDASVVTVTSAVPADTSLVGVTASSGWSAMTPLVGGTGDIVFSKSTVSFLESASFTIVVQVDGGAASGTVITNTATAAAMGSIDEVSGNDSQDATSWVDAEPPSVVAVTTASGPITDCAQLRTPFSSIVVEIEDLESPIQGADDLANYLLVAAGPDGEFTTPSCTVGPLGDDVLVGFKSLSLDAADPLAVTATLHLAEATNGLEPGLFRIFVCDAITDSAGIALDGDGDTFPGGDLEIPVFRADPNNLLVNGRFDDCPVSLDPWIQMASSPNEVTILPTGSGDASGSTLSAGANLYLEVKAETAMGQCAAVESGEDYSLAANVRFTSSGSATAQIELGCEFYSGAICDDGTLLGVFADMIQADDQGGDWISLGGRIRSPIGSQSTLCYIAATPSEPSADVAVDDVYFGNPWVIFLDGFESGDTSAWSAVWP